MDNTKTNLEWALYYRSIGWSPFPVGKNKIPLCDWKKYQTEIASDEELALLWKNNPDANIGIATGKVSSLVVFDIDAKHNRSSKEFQIPPTVCSRTGGGGEHFFFKYPGKFIKSTNGQLFGVGIDVKADGGYVVVAPSLHLSGNRYEWTVSPDDAEVADIPVWLKAEFDKQQDDKKDVKLWQKEPDEIVEGSRSNAMTSYTGKILHELPIELWNTAGWDSVVARNNRLPEPLEEKELRSIFESVRKYPTEAVKSESVMEQCNLVLSRIPKDTPKESILNVLTPLFEILVSGDSLEEAEIYIRNKVKTELDIKPKDVNLIIKHFRKMKYNFILKVTEAKKKAEQLETEPEMTEEEKQTAEKILKSPTLLFDILQMVKKLGVVGEEKNVLLHYIIFTSRKLKNPLSATVKGDSSSGKSYTLLTTIKLFPKSAYIDLTDATPQSFFYCEEDHFKHKIIVIFEKHGGERADYAIRTLQSEGKLKIQVTIKNPDTGQFEAQTIEKEGPTGFVTTTTASYIHAENDTRNISMFPDQSSEQTSRVYESVDARYTGRQPISDEEIKPWQNAQLVLEEMPVYIPFVKSFRKYFPNHIVRTRRDYGHFLAIVESVAFLHQKQREKIELYGKKYIKATLADAYIAKIIVEDSLSKSIYELPEKTIELIEMAHIIVTEDDVDGFPPSSDETFTITQLAKKLGWDRDTVAKWMKPASKKGYTTVVTDSKGPKGAEFKLEAKELPGDTFLPSIEDLILDNPEENIENIYNPLTGESVTMEVKAEMPSTDAPTESEEQENILKENSPAETIVASVEDSSGDEEIDLPW